MTPTRNNVEPTTSATERLRALLDERGVEHVDAEDGHTQHTWWSDGDHEIAASNSGGERLAVYGLTPAQAIDATLGRGTCHFEQIPEALYDDIECSECGVALWGFQMDIDGEGCPTKPRYCPACGKRVVE